MVVMDVGNPVVSILVHPEKAHVPIVVIVFGRTTLVSSVQFENTPVPLVLFPLGMDVIEPNDVTDVIFVLVKAYPAKEVRLAKFTVPESFDPLNADSPIGLIELVVGIVKVR